MVYLKKVGNPKRLGVVSLITGFALEFALMRPDWVQRICGQLPMQPMVFIAVTINVIYWFSLWFVPAYVLNRFKFAR